MLMRCNNYGEEIDMWSVGCIFAELATGSPFFEGSSEIEQLFRIFSITGVPQKELMQIISPGLKLAPLPNY